MATRLYVSQATPGITPTPSSGWEDTANFLRRTATITVASFDDTGTPATSATGNANDDVLWYQMIYGPLDTQTLTGTFKGQISARESNALADARIQCIIRTIQSDGSTVRGTNLAMSTAALSHEFVVDATNRRNITIPLGGSTSLTSVGIVAGDYLVIEVGFRGHGTSATVVRGKWTWDGADSSDAAENETTQMPANVRGWLEFSQTLVPYTAAPATAATGTGAASNAKNTIAPTLTSTGRATGTGAANAPAVSFLPPPRSLTVAGTDYSDKTRWQSFNFVECANRGEVGMGGFDVDDATNSLSIPALKAVTALEPAAGPSNWYMFTGYTHDRTTERGPNKVAGQRQWGVEVVDLNTLADDYVLTAAETADRPAETDYVRVAWLLTSRFNSSGGVGVGYVPNTNTVNMDAVDYRGRTARDVLNECSEAAGKNWFIYNIDGSADLFYDLTSGSNFSTTSRISDVWADVDSSTTWAPVGPPSVKKSPDDIYSTIHLTYAPEATTPATLHGTVSVTNATTASTYRTREIAVTDNSVSTAVAAAAKAAKFLAASAAEKIRVESVSVALPAANVNDFRAGQRVQIKLDRHGISAFTYYRIIRREVKPLNDVRYLVTLTLSDQVLPNLAGGGRGNDIYGIWERKSNATDDGATVIVDRSGINIINGAITVVNSGSTVVIDGESNMFKISATGTQNSAVAAGAGGGTSTTLSGLGAFSATPMALTLNGDVNSSVARRDVGFWTSAAHDAYAAATSGGAVTKAIVSLNNVAWGYTSLDGSNFVVVSLLLRGVTGGGGFTGYQRYYVLEETAI